MDGAIVKTLKEIFKDFNSSSTVLLDSTIKNMNLFKKTNILEIELHTQKHINIRDIFTFEKYLESRFHIKEANIKIETESEDEIEDSVCEGHEHDNDISKEWQDIIEYMAIKHPMTKAILNNSLISIDGKIANVMITMKGKEFLIAKKLDETLSSILLNFYGKKYKVVYIENISEEKIKERQENARIRQEELIQEIQKETENKKEENKKQENIQNEKNQNKSEEFLGEPNIE